MVREEHVPAQQLLVRVRAVPPGLARQVSRFGPERDPRRWNGIEVKQRIGREVAGASDTVDVAGEVDLFPVVVQRYGQLDRVVANVTGHLGRTAQGAVFYKPPSSALDVFLAGHRSAVPRPGIFVLVEHNVSSPSVRAAAPLVVYRPHSARVQLDPGELALHGAQGLVWIARLLVPVHPHDAQGRVSQGGHRDVGQQPGFLVGVLGAGGKVFAGVVEVAHPQQLVGPLGPIGVDQLELREPWFGKDCLDLDGSLALPGQRIEHSDRLCFAVCLDATCQVAHRLLAKPVGLEGHVPPHFDGVRHVLIADVETVVGVQRERFVPQVLHPGLGVGRAHLCREGAVNLGLDELVVNAVAPVVQAVAAALPVPERPANGIDRAAEARDRGARLFEFGEVLCGSDKA